MSGDLDLAGVIAAATSAPGVQLEVATVTAVSAGAAADGTALVTVSWRGASLTASYLSSWAPTVGHVVLVAYRPPSLVILGRVIGTPP